MGDCVCVCVGVDIVFISFLEMLRFPGAKKLIFPHFWHRIPHINWLLPQLCKKQKKKKPSKLITVPSSGHTSLVHLCVTALTTEPAHLTNPVLADLKYLGWTQTSTYMHLQIHWHTQFSLFVFFFSTNDRWVQFLVYWLNAFMELHLWSRLGFRGKTNRPD